MRQRFQTRLDRLDLPDGPVDMRPVTDADIAGLPVPAQRYLRFMGVIGKPRDWSFRCRFTGEFRQRAGQRWMACDAWQSNTSVTIARIFYMRIDFAGVVPMFGSDTYRSGRGRMVGKVLGLVTVADGAGHEFDVGELVTYVNDAFMLAPSMLLTPAVHWDPVDEGSFDVTVSDADLTVTARVFVDGQGRLIDFSTTDRYLALPSGLVQARWSTPVAGWTSSQGRRFPTYAEAVWHVPEGEFPYIRGRFDPETFEHNTSPMPAPRPERA
jgi:hypothetical protein